MSLFCTISEILSIISQNLKRSYDRDHAHLMDCLSIQRLMVHMANPQNLKSLFTHYENMKATQNVENWVVWEARVI